MSWLELDDGILEHPKFIRAAKLGGSEAIHLWLGLRAYCGKHLTDGVIPSDMIDEVRGPSNPEKRAEALRALFTAGLLEHGADDSIVMHDFLDWSSSRAAVIAARERARERKSKSRGGHGGQSGNSSVTGNVTTRAVPHQRGEEMEREEEEDPERSGSQIVEQPAKTPARFRDPKALAKAFRADKLRTGDEFGLFETWPEVKAICSAFEKTWGRKDVPRHGGDPRARVIIDRFEEGYTVEQLCRAIRQSRFADYIAGNQAHQALVTLLRDAAQVDKFCALTAPPAPRVPAKSVLNQPHEGNADHETRRALGALKGVRELIDLAAPTERGRV